MAASSSSSSSSAADSCSTESASDWHLNADGAMAVVKKATLDWEEHVRVKEKLCELARVLPGECAARLRDQFGIDVDTVKINRRALLGRNTRGAVVLALPISASPMPLLLFAGDAARIERTALLVDRVLTVTFDLSDGALTEVFRLLDGRDLLSCRRVCRQWASVGRSDVLWRRFFDPQDWRIFAPPLMRWFPTIVPTVYSSQLDPRFDAHTFGAARRRIFYTLCTIFRGDCRSWTQSIGKAYIRCHIFNGHRGHTFVSRFSGEFPQCLHWNQLVSLWSTYGKGSWISYSDLLGHYRNWTYPGFSDVRRDYHLMAAWSEIGSKEPLRLTRKQQLKIDELAKKIGSNDPLPRSPTRKRKRKINEILD